MEERKKGSYREQVVHMTRALPYSVHRSFFGEKDSQALYLHWHPEMEPSGDGAVLSGGGSRQFCRGG